MFLDQGNVQGPTSIIQSNVDPLEPYFEVEFAIPFDNGLLVGNGRICVLTHFYDRAIHVIDVHFQVKLKERYFNSFTGVCRIASSDRGCNTLGEALLL